MTPLSFRQRQFLTLLVLAVVPLTIAMGLGLPGARNIILQGTTARLQVVADRTTLQIQQWLNQGRKVARLTAELYDLQEALPTLLAPEDADAGALVQAKLYAVLRKFVDIFPDVRSISLLHPTRGRVLLSTDRRLETRERRDEEYFRAGQQDL